ncbi:MAG TPA: biotin/lipoyl-containing protein, partial [Verrucomicrobiae bacterium]|nr:biotin/lipoyl-containing protein [Verrucomicrobiae bacterium]
LIMKKLKITINNITYMVTVEEERETALKAVEPHGIVGRPAPSRPSIQPVAAKPAPAAANGGGNDITAPMPGVVLAVKFKEGDTVNIGDVVLVLEAMKMENEITAKRPGIIKEIKVKEGQTVAGGEVLVAIE